jgi:hypothetical protein
MRQREDESNYVADVSGVDTEPTQLPQDFTCVDPEQGILVFDYLNGSSTVDKETILLHLRLCLHCQEVITVWRGVHHSLEAEAVNQNHSAATRAAEAGGNTTLQETKSGVAKPSRLKAKGTHGN